MRPRTFLTLALVLGTSSVASARPAHKEALADHFGPFLVKKLNDCRTCHVPGEYKEDEDRPHNPFGARLKEVRGELRKAGKKLDIPTRVDTVSNEDADGDGITNLLELLAGRNPGDKDDKPTEAEITEVKKKLEAFAKFRQSYPWRPYEVVKRPEVPRVKNAAWVKNPIDAFLAAGHEELGLKPRPEASKHVLLRRVYLDLTGLSPTPEEVQAFLDDAAADAYEKVVDRLLASPRYGERWGRHWMDVWRYSDWAGWTGGGQIRDSQPHIWRWRDWIVESLNADKPYDRMVLEMLAGDELAPDDPATLRATGYLVRNYKMLSREKWLQDTVDHTFQAFLGTTVGCARCHDHMYDPIKQKEYYQIRAIFEPHQVRTDPVPGELDAKKDGLVHVYDADLKAPTYFLVRGDDRTPDKSAVIPPGVPEALGGKFPDIAEVKLPRAAYAPEKQAWVVQEVLKSSAAGLTKPRDAATAARRPAIQSVTQLFGAGSLDVVLRSATAQRLLDAQVLAELDLALAEARHASLVAVVQAEQLEEAGKKDSDEWKQAATTAGTAQRRLAVLDARKNLLAAEQAQRAAPEKMKPEAAKKAAAAAEALAKAEKAAEQPPAPAYTPRTVKTYPQTSSGRRLAFARWVADPENPLTARVAVNHMWLRHFGQALVPRTFDFGKNGLRPTQPALLDWLAAELMAPGANAPGSPGRAWSMKHLHKLIVTSSAYRMASTPDEKNLTSDQDNRFVWRMNSRRLEAELVRDGLFYVAGKLDLAMGGPDIDQNLGLTSPRRSIYFRHAQEKQMEFLKIFDAASCTECYERKESVIPQQALALANSELAIRHARLVARSIKADDAEAFIKAAFARVLSRPPTAEELAECAGFLKEQAQRLTQGPAPADERAPAGDPALRARENLVSVLLNHHDFVTIR